MSPRERNLKMKELGKLFVKAIEGLFFLLELGGRGLGRLASAAWANKGCSLVVILLLPCVVAIVAGGLGQGQIAAYALTLYFPVIAAIAILFGLMLAFKPNLGASLLFFLLAAAAIWATKVSFGW